VEVVRSACPLNCPDSCSFLVEQVPGQGLRVRGDQNPVTQGFVCSKGQALAHRVFAPERLRFPLRREGAGWRRLSWEQAYQLAVDKIRETLAEVGSWGIFHHFDYGHNGVLRSLDRRFFQALGGVTEPGGSMCWGAGYRAQELDFGAVYASDWSDLAAARTIVLWGRDPALTNIHLVPYILAAKKSGAKVYVINPQRVRSAAFADEYLQVNPGSDGILALGLGHIILRERWADLEFVHRFIQGFEGYARRAKEYPPELVAELTGVPVQQQGDLARRLTHARPASLVLGYGLQRYANGGSTVRAIDALAAISGNIGREGAGVHYAHQYHHGRLNTLLLPPESYRARVIAHPDLAAALPVADPPVRLAVVTRSNPLVQQPDSIRWREAWERIPFKIVLDMVMTETARRADLVLPVTTIFEEEDLIVTSWSPLIQYAQRVVEPQGEAKPEPEIFAELAVRLGRGEYFAKTSRQWLEYVLEPLAGEGITLAKLAAGPVRPSYIPRVAWAAKDFRTQSGKIELDSAWAAAEMGDSVAAPGRGQPNPEQEYPYYLLTPHPGQALHSQFQADEGFRALVHPTLAAAEGLQPGDWVIVETRSGQLKAQLLTSESIHPRAVVLPEGATADGYGVNALIRASASDCGQTTAYYQEFCHIRLWCLD